MTRLDIGETIAERRKALGLTQKDLATHLSVTDKAVSKWERGQGYPDITMLNDLARALDLPMADLMRETSDQGQSGLVVETVTPAPISIPAPGANPAAMATADEPEPLPYDPEPAMAKETRAPLASRLRTWLAKRSPMIVHIVRLVFTALCAIAIAVCVIVDLAVTGGITWSAIVIVAVLAGWLPIMMVLPFSRMRLLAAAPVLGVMTVVLLETIRRSFDGRPPSEGTGFWEFWAVAGPPTLIGAVGLVLMVLVLFFVKIRLWYRLALLALLGGVIDWLVETSVADAMGQSQGIADAWIDSTLYALAAVLLALGGAALSRAPKSKLAVAIADVEDNLQRAGQGPSRAPAIG